MVEPDALPWDSEEFRHALANKQPGHAFALVRKAKGLAQVDFGVLMYWDRSQAGRIERDETDTIRDIYLMGQTADVLGIPRLALLPALLETPNPGTIEVKDNEGADAVDRRQFGQAGLILLGTAAAATSAVKATAATPPLIGADHIRVLSKAADQLWARDNDFGSGQLVQAALDQFAMGRRLLDYGDYDARTGTELAAVVGNLGLVSGWLAYDGGDQDTARRCYNDALVLAERGADNSLAANVLGALRLQAWAIGRMREALQLSLRASDRSRHDGSARMQALLAAYQGVAYAAVGDHRECERALSVAWREVDRGLDDPNDPVRLHFVTESEIRSIEARARTFLGERGYSGQHERAVDIYRRSVGADGSKPRDEASYRAYFAASIARLGDTRTAVAEGLAALALLEGPVASPRLVAELQPVRTAAAKTRDDDAEQFRTRFDALSVVT
jgi:tetratricopeptide (TPR) repeat protein